MLDRVLQLTAATTYTIHVGKCKLFSVTIAGDGANGDCQLYDGQNTSGKQLTHLEALSGTSHQSIFSDGILCDQGLYLVANAATTKVTVEYEPIS